MDTLVGYVKVNTPGYPSVITCYKVNNTRPNKRGQNADYIYQTQILGRTYPTLLGAVRHVPVTLKTTFKFVNLACCIPSCSCPGLGTSV